jgi:hypothetical protein
VRSTIVRIACGLAATVTLLASGARAAPVSLQLDGEGGLFYQSLSGWVRDDDALALRVSVGIGPFVAIDVGLSEDLERIEPAVHLGAHLRPWAGRCWHARGSPYLRADVAVVGASQSGYNYDFTVGAGHWGKLTPRLGWFAELDTVARVGDYDAFALHLVLGVSVSSRAFWR